VAEAEVALRQQEKISAEASLETSEDSLRLLIDLTEEAPAKAGRIVPQDQPQNPTAEPDIDTARRSAGLNRLELRVLALKMESLALSLKSLKQEQRPDLTISGQIALNGLSGESQYNTTTDGSADYFEAFSTMKDSPAYSLMLQFSMPLGNRAAKSGYHQGLFSRQQLEIMEKSLRQEINRDVQAACRQVQTSIKQLDAARVTVDLSRRQMEAEAKKLELGASTHHDVLTFQEKYTRAQSSYSQALIGYNIALAHLELAKGTIMAAYNVQFSR
jgi:outer membrane protein TolC